jgi:RHS repeat-associated protein
MFRSSSKYNYFYNTDHLGSSSWITDASGSATQHLQYLPYGEDYIYQRNSSWAVPYTFSGKEKDSETGYSYFGARYYDSDLSVWLSVDPLADKYPSMSSYMYVAGNPVMLVDPDGRFFTDFVNSETGDTKHVDDGVDQIVVVSNQDYNKVDNAWFAQQSKNTWSRDDEYFKIIDGGENIDLDSDLGKIIRMTYAEMYGVGKTSNTDRQIVAESIVNRKESNRFPDTYSEVIEGGEYDAFGTLEYDNPYKSIAKLKKESPSFYKKYENEITGNWLNAISTAYKAYNHIGSEIGNGAVFYVSPPRKSNHFDNFYLNITSQITGLKGIVGVWKLK